VLAIAVTAVSTAIVAAQKQNSAQEDDSIAVGLARQLMEEIASRPLPASLPDSTAGWPTVTNRTTYDTIDDFNGYTDTISLPVRLTNAVSTSSNFTSARPTVTTVAGGVGSIQLTAQQFSRTVSVSYPTSIFGTTVTSGDFAVVTLTVRGGRGSKVTISRLFSKLTITR
jgi:hypothetical protein